MPDTDPKPAPLCARQTCTECPFLRDTPPGQFTPERFIALAETARPGLDPFQQRTFACHKSKLGGEFACAGFMLVCGIHSNRVRMAWHHGTLPPLDQITATGPLHPSYRAMAVANGVPADHPSLREMPR